MDRTATLMPGALAPQFLYRRANLSTMHFETTADIEVVEGIIGQERAVEAVRFGSRIDKTGFNLFVIGTPEARMRPTVQAMLKRQAAAEDPPCDWVYVNNFTEPHKPVAIALPASRAPHFS